MNEVTKMSTSAAGNGGEYSGTDDFVAYCLYGNTQIFERIVQKLTPQLYSHLYRFLRDASLVEDVMQQAWTNIVEKRDLFQEDQDFKSWLNAIAMNLARDLLRQRGRHPMISIHGSATEQVNNRDAHERSMADPFASPLEEVMKNEEILILRALVAQLPGREQEIVRLTYWEDKSSKEIGAALKMSAGAVRQSLKRIRKILREILEKQDLAA